MANRDFKYGENNIPVQQVPTAFEIFTSFFAKESFDYVIEIGTSYGGLSLYLHEQSLINNFKFTTYDISDSRLKRAWGNLQIPFDYRIEDCFSQTTKEEIVGVLQNNKCLLLCDGGNKIEEFNTFGAFLSKGSYIMAHDYSPNKEYFKANISNKVWNWLEIRDSDVAAAQTSYNLRESDYHSDFTNVVWLSCIKV